MIKKLLITLGLMISFGLFAEPRTCKVYIDSAEELRDSIEKCEGGDLLWWRGANYLHPLMIVARYCDQEKAITVNDNLTSGVCTYTGEMLMPRD